MNGMSSAPGLSPFGATADERRPTRMDNFSRRFADARRRLTSMNDLLAQRLDNFAPVPIDPRPGDSSVSKTILAPEPTPGTAASLEYIADGTEYELARLDELLGRLQAIL